MLKKLYLYDSKNLFKALFPIVLSIFGAGVVCFGLFFFATLAPEDLSILAILPCIFLLFLIMIGGALGMLYPYFYYFRSFYTDTAYFTFSFPASAKTQFHSKILSGATYMYVVGLSMVASLIIAFLGAFFGILADTIINPSDLIESATPGGVSSALSALDIATFILCACYIILTPFISLLIGYTAINLGALILKKHKVLGAILFYFITSWVVSFVETIISVIFSLVFSNLSPSLNTFLSYLIQVLLGVGIAIGAYFLSKHLLTKKFNLE